jgi:CBS domain-containing protein
MSLLDYKEISHPLIAAPTFSHYSACIEVDNVVELTFHSTEKENIMTKAYDVMTQSLATCSPEDNASHVAMIMRERNIGNVLIVEDGRLRGIVTDRDLALNALTSSNDPLHMPVRSFMSDNVVTGSPEWTTGRMARTMAKHQIRRLPIVDEGQLVGIVSLADIATHENRKGLVTRSLKAISSPSSNGKSNGSAHTGALIGLGLLAAASTAVAMLTWNRSGKELSKQVADTQFYQSAQQAVGAARDRVDEAASSKTARNLRQRMNANMKELSYQLPRIEYKPPRRKTAWFR